MVEIPTQEAVGRRRTTAILLALCVALLLTGVLGMLMGAGSAKGKVYPFTVVTAMGFTLLGAIITPRRERNSVGPIMLAIGFSSAIVVASGGLAEYRLAEWLNQWLPTIVYGLLPPLLLVFPDGRLPSRRWRPVVVVAVTGMGLGAVALAVAAWDVPGVLADIDAARTPLAIAAIRIARFSLLAVLASLVAAVFALGVRFRASEGDTRQQVKWLALGGAVVAVAVTGDAAGLPYIPELVGAAALPASMTAAILKYRLYDLDLIINRSLVYAILTIFVLGTYTAIVTVLSGVLSARTSWIPPVVATATVALAFHPLRERVQRGASRLLYGDRDDPYNVLTRLGRRLEQVVDPAAVLSNVVESVAEALQVPYVAIELWGVHGDRLAATYGRSGMIVPDEFPMTYQGERVGTLVASPRSAAGRFTPAERRLLGDLARQAGLAAHAVRVTAELQRSREHLVRSREEERRRLRRDLHDGLGPALAGMTMQIGATRASLPVDADGMGATLGRLEDQLEACVTEIRRLIDDLRPAALGDVGLVEAIRHRLGAFSSAGDAVPELDVHPADNIRELPAAVEVAAYRIAIEAVTNSVRHAHATRCEVRIALEEDLTVEVLDNGVGLAQDARPGVGLASMRERAEEIGGTFSAERRAEGGTRIRATLPLVPS